MNPDCPPEHDWARTDEGDSRLLFAVDAGAGRVGRGVRAVRRRPGGGRVGQPRRVAPADSTSSEWPTAPRSRSTPRRSKRCSARGPTRPSTSGFGRPIADTAAAQWELAQWCREHKLSAEREVHLRRVIELDPDHVEARRALGYSKIDGQWTTQEEAMTKRGYVRYKGQWKTPQEVEIAEEQAEARSGPAGVVPEAEALARLAGHRPRPAGPRQHPRHRGSRGDQGIDGGIARRRGPAGADRCLSRPWRRSTRPRPPWRWPSRRFTTRWKRCG